MQSDNISRDWGHFISINLPNYEIAFQKTMLALGLFLLVRKDQARQLIVCKYWTVKLGKLGMANKGAQCVVVNFRNAFLFLGNCHLAAGEQYSQRCDGFRKICQELYQQHFFFDNIKCMFLFGDFNFRVRSPLEKIWELVNLHHRSYI